MGDGQLLQWKILKTISMMVIFLREMIACVIDKTNIDLPQNNLTTFSA
jgi:hypothetical protein